uniref:Uncharacterized protein n=1 Tax=Physcomitrium patens TaxID=3218 RepID=A0A2K1KV56_PHYPA|nr:hypothetical protein PHYPA_004642 [Physcomitrium patens]
MSKDSKAWIHKPMIDNKLQFDEYIIILCYFISLYLQKRQLVFCILRPNALK